MKLRESLAKVGENLNKETKLTQSLPLSEKSLLSMQVHTKWVSFLAQDYGDQIKSSSILKLTRA